MSFEYQHHANCSAFRSQPVGSEGCICVVTYRRAAADVARVVLADLRSQEMSPELHPVSYSPARPARPSSSGWKRRNDMSLRDFLAKLPFRAFFVGAFVLVAVYLVLRLCFHLAGADHTDWSAWIDPRRRELPLVGARPALPHLPEGRVRLQGLTC